MKNNFFFVHIPKTAGTFFRSILDDLYDWDLETMSIDPLRFNKHMLGNSTPQCGHLMYKEVSYLLDLGYDLITFVRDPVERMISHYYFLIEYKTPNFIEGESLIDFAERNSNYQTGFLGNDLNKYAFVGITEFFEEEIYRFSKWVGTDINYSKYSRLNVGSIKKPVSKKDRSIISDFCKEDIKLYTLAKAQRMEAINV